MYIGRFAPSPTGPLHFGSMVAAVASYLEARTHQGKWLIRIEDIDPPREVPGSASLILSTLDAFGMHWDGEVVYQSQRLEVYEETLSLLKKQHVVYPCTCSRKEIAQIANHGIEGLIYPGTCRAAPAYTGFGAYAWRVCTDSIPIHFNDDIQGPQTQNLEKEIGDFILKRADGLYAYQLAVVVDDFAQGVTHVVRGADLLTSTPRQIYLHRLLGWPISDYAHVPVALDANGEKLSKQTRAPSVTGIQPQQTLWQVLKFLGQNPPTGLQHMTLHELWTWALTSWRLLNVPRQHGQPIPH